jgi:hypothetical protein
MYIFNYENDNDNDNDNENKECLICWETSYIDNIVESMKKFKKYDIECDCYAYFHSNCFDKWILQQNLCPICRNNTIIKINPYSNTYYLLYCSFIYSFRYIIYSILCLLLLCNLLVLIGYFMIITRVIIL